MEKPDMWVVEETLIPGHWVVNNHHDEGLGSSRAVPAYLQDTVQRIVNQALWLYADQVHAQQRQDIMNGKFYTEMPSPEGVVKQLFNTEDK